MQWQYVAFAWSELHHASIFLAHWGLTGRIGRHHEQFAEPRRHANLGKFDGIYRLALCAAHSVPRCRYAAWGCIQWQLLDGRKLARVHPAKQHSALQHTRYCPRVFPECHGGAARAAQVSHFVGAWSASADCLDIEFAGWKDQGEWRNYSSGLQRRNQRVHY